MLLKKRRLEIMPMKFSGDCLKTQAKAGLFIWLGSCKLLILLLLPNYPTSLLLFIEIIYSSKVVCSGVYMSVMGVWDFLYFYRMSVKNPG